MINVLENQWLSLTCKMPGWDLAYTPQENGVYFIP